MLRACTSSALAFLLTITLLWGGCISCPQFFMFPGMNSATKKSCCDKTGKCSRTESNTSGEKDCQKMPMEAHASGQLDLAPPAVQGALEILCSSILSASLASSGLRHLELAVEHSPPDLQALNSTFLI